MELKSNKKMKSKSKGKLSDCPPTQNGSITINKSNFPMEPFKGTKSHLFKVEDDDKILNPGNKRKANTDFESSELHTKKEKMAEYDPLKLMNELEKFSDVWNDCPNIENPKSGFEIVPNKTEKEVTKQKKDHSIKIREPELTKHSVLNGNIENNKKKSVLDKHQQNSQSSNIKIETKDRKNSGQFQYKKVENNIGGKYDSKLAEIKRKKAVEEQSQLHSDQKSIIKKALSCTDNKQQLNQKIVFSDAEDNEEIQTKVLLEGSKTMNQKLFDESDDDGSSEVELKLKINRQFEGKKGQKLLELQSKFASDSRFAMDSRFHDSESENEKDEASDNLDVHEEKKRQLEILESIVKQPIRPLSETRRLPGKKSDEPLMVRFDPSREDHQKYLLKFDNSSNKHKLNEKRKKPKKDTTPPPNVEKSRPEVSSVKMYAVKEDLKEVLKKENKTEFSLLKLFGSKDEDSNIHQDSNESTKKLKYAPKNPFKYDSSESDDDEEGNKEKNELKDKSDAQPSLPSWRTTFFFTEKDSRFKEAEEFLKFNDELEGDEKFAEKRKMLKDFIRHKLKNNKRKKDPFKKKLGGVKKKVFYKKKGK